MESNVLKAVEEISGYTPDEMIAMYNDYERMAKECEACATLKEQTRWIPVSERLPEVKPKPLSAFATDNGEQFLTCDDVGYIEITSFWAREKRFDNECVTYWMPLPEAPKEADHADS